MKHIIDKPKFMHNFPKDRKKEVRESILKSIEKRKEQIEFFEKNFILPQKKVMELGKEVLQGKIPIQMYINENERLSKYILGCLSVRPKASASF